METLFSRAFVLLIICLFQNIYAQESEIVKILNQNLKEDLEIKAEYNHFDDTLRIIKPYAIANGILSIEIESKKGNIHYVEKREVPISEIDAVEKDINVIFSANNDAVKITTTYLKKLYDEKDGTETSSLFFTGIRLQRQNKFLGESLQKAFEKAGYKIELGSWYD
ncbi:hypothetical protein [Epilithonimonas xixisoli]|uniref:Uncharacterized protein n=1 Tax=Epilithonimonas xixisoli TaxID=1476462 RepID=A0A4R8IDX9_9FLAO|nr:hypothetical protein [Epilithonimonas xixisoli]TDX83319.1 hypothetical protein B0I22_3399 [Epilithonimonas xixisoli]